MEKFSLKNLTKLEVSEDVSNSSWALEQLDDSGDNYKYNLEPN